MLQNSLFFIVGLALLVKGADFLVEGSVSIAKKFGISSLVIGLTVVAFGTSIPELVVSTMASLRGNTELAIGNILGSNISNILLILGIAATIYPVMVKSTTIWKEIPFSLLAVIVLFFMANDMLLDETPLSQLSRSDGFTLAAFFVVFLAYIFSIAKQGGVDKPLDHQTIQEKPAWQSTSMVLIGLIGLTLGGKWMVESAVVLANFFEVSEAFIGLTIVAVGTSLPELATSVVAAYKKQSDLVIGNIIGSNIFNIFWILGVSAIIRPLHFGDGLNQDILMVVMSTFLLFVFLLRGGEKNQIVRWQGIVFIALYIGYIGYLVSRG